MNVLGHKAGTPFQDGALFAKAADLGTFALFWQNADLLRALNKRLKLFRGEDGWFAKGRQGQLWEWGRGKLGFTVGTSRMISNALEAGFVPAQRGDQEANFSCAWTDETIERLIKLLRLRTRGVGNPSPKPMPERRNGKISAWIPGQALLAGQSTRRGEKGGCMSAPAEADTGPPDPRMRRPGVNLANARDVDFSEPTVDIYASGSQLSSDPLRLACAALSAEVEEWLGRYVVDRRENMSRRGATCH